MWLTRMVKLLAELNKPIVKFLKNIAMGILFAIMLLTTVDVFLRYFFNRPVTGAYELIEFMMSILISFGLGYCAIEGAHVSVDLVVSFLSQRIQAIIRTVTSFLSVVLFFIIAWQNVIYIGENIASQLKSAVLMIPVYPFVATVAIGSAVLCLVLIMNFFKSLSEAIKK